MNNMIKTNQMKSNVAATCQRIPTGQTHRLTSTASRFIGILAICMWAVGASAQTTPFDGMAFQSYLVDSNGAAISGNRSLKFSIFDADSSGNLKWAETQTVTVNAGNFSVILGEGTWDTTAGANRVTLATVFNGTERYIEIAVEGTALSPRLRMLPSPFSFKAKNADHAVNATNATNADVAVAAIKIVDTNGSDRMTFAGSNGNVNGNFTALGKGGFGLGTGNSPQYPLHVNNTTGGTTLYLKDANGSLSLGAQNTSYYHFDTDRPMFHFNKMIVTDKEIQGTHFYASNASYFRGTGRPGVAIGSLSNGLSDNIIEGLDSSGNMSSLHLNYYSTEPVYAGLNGGGGMRVYGKQNSLGYSTWPMSLYVGSIDDQLGTISGPGRIAIGFHNNRHIYFIDEQEDHYTASLSEGGTWWTNSDIRLKKDIEGLGNVLDRLVLIRGVKYKYTYNKSNEIQLGVIAQEVEKHFPDLVNVMMEGEGGGGAQGQSHLGVNYDGFAPVLIEAVKELRAEKDSEINELKERLAKLEKLVAKLGGPEYQ